MYDIGIDLGTSAVKLLLVSDEGTVAKTVSRSYPLEFPQPGWSQQKPADWWGAILDGIPELIAGIDPAEVGGIGTAGQMHGLVALDGSGNVLRPAILWNDGRTAAETDRLNNETGRDFLLEHTGNIAFAGFTAPKLLWMKNHEPDLFGKIRMVLLPKDYVNYKLTGRYTSDYSDAAGTLLLDVKNKRWSPEMLDQTCGCVVECDNIDALQIAIEQACNEEKYTEAACVFKASLYNKNDTFKQYIDMYGEVIYD